MEWRGLIVGAGIGGLTAALALRRAGLEAVVLERAPVLHEVAAAICLWPDAVEVLRRLGVGDALEEMAAARTEDGTRVLVLHRASLQAALREALEPGVIRLGTPCLLVDQDAVRATVTLVDGRSEAGDLVVGADGLASRVRAVVFGEDAPRYSGRTAWRAVVPVDESLAGRVDGAGSRRRFSTFGVARLRGSQVYWWAGARSRERPAGSPADEKADLLRRFGRWHDPIPALIEATPAEAILRTGLYLRPPLPRVSCGRVALLGDAAHLGLPGHGRGACEAIEDAAVLADELERSPDVARALATYDRRRNARARG